jgi:hypothetical protein
MHMSLPFLSFSMSNCDNKISVSQPKHSANVMRYPPRTVSPKQTIRSMKGMMSPLHELTVKPTLSPLSCITYEDDDYSISTNECPGSTDTRFRSPCSKLRQQLQQLKQASTTSTTTTRNSKDTNNNNVGKPTFTIGLFTNQER